MMKKKLNNKKGFTLAELLIVVAIIGILVAVSVPVFTSKLADAKKATDDANVRAAKAAAVTAILAEDIKENQTVYYDAENGVLVSDKPSTGYGKVQDGAVIKITVTSGSPAITWEPKTK